MASVVFKKYKDCKRNIDRDVRVQTIERAVLGTGQKETEFRKPNPVYGRRVMNGAGEVRFLKAGATESANKQ
jgi:hypothetical protein